MSCICIIDDFFFQAEDGIRYLVRSRGLGEVYRGQHVNLVPLNPTPGYPVVGAAPKRLFEFRDLLEEGGATATVRRTRGLDIDAACGQLAARHRSEASNATEQPVAGPSRRSPQLGD